MGKAVLGVIVGFVVWTAVWLGGGIGLMAAFPDAIEEDGRITGAGLNASTLALSVICSLLAGLICRAIAGPGRSALVLAVALLLVGIGVQASAWDRMPLWFHVPFLVLIVPMTLAGGALVRRGSGS